MDDDGAPIAVDLHSSGEEFEDDARSVTVSPSSKTTTTPGTMRKRSAPGASLVRTSQTSTSFNAPTGAARHARTSQTSTSSNAPEHASRSARDVYHAPAEASSSAYITPTAVRGIKNFSTEILKT